MALTAAAESQSKRGTILIVVIAVHAIGLWVVESGLSRSIIEMVAPPVETKIIEEEKPPEEPPPPPPPPVDATPPPPYIPPVEVQVQLPPPVNTITAEVKETPPPVTPPVMAPPTPAAPPGIPGTRPAINPKLTRPANDFYPSGSRNDKEEGFVVVKCNVGLDGKCTNPSVDTSSGFPRLDEAAIKYATQGVRFVPGTEDGKPVAMTHMFRVAFKLTVTH